MKVKTSILQELSQKIVKGNLGDKNLFISNYTKISADKQTLTLHNTDIDNHLEVSANIEDKSSFDMIVDTNLFNKLINSIESDYVNFSKQGEEYVISYGNSNYKFPVILDSLGAEIQLENFELPKEGVTISAQDLNIVLRYLPSCIGTDFVNNVLTGMYIGKKAYSSNRFKACILNINLLKDSSPILLPSKFINLLKLLESDDEIFYAIDSNGIYFVSRETTIVGLDMKELSQYPVSALDDFSKSNLKYAFSVSNKDLKKVINRVSILCKDDELLVNLAPKDKVLLVINQSGNGVDEVPIKWESEVPKDWSELVNYKFLLNILQTMEESIKIEFENSQFIRLKDKFADNILSIVKVNQNA